VVGNLSEVAANAEEVAWAAEVFVLVAAAEEVEAYNVEDSCQWGVDQCMFFSAEFADEVVVFEDCWAPADSDVLLSSVPGAPKPTSEKESLPILLPLVESH
jgi:hypothetical protein